MVVEGDEALHEVCLVENKGKDFSLIDNFVQNFR